jgi:hypothetical protein
MVLGGHPFASFVTLMPSLYHRHHHRHRITCCRRHRFLSLEAITAIFLVSHSRTTGRTNDITAAARCGIGMHGSLFNIVSRRDAALPPIELSSHLTTPPPQLRSPIGTQRLPIKLLRQPAVATASQSTPHGCCMFFHFLFNTTMR